MSIDLNIKLYCRCCGQKLYVYPYYAYQYDSTVFNVQPCKKGCSELDMEKALEAGKKERLRLSKIPEVPVFGDHLRSSR